MKSTVGSPTLEVSPSTWRLANYPSTALTVELAAASSSAILFSAAASLLKLLALLSSSPAHHEL
ncbi:MAG: hypothetical protein DRK00_07380 [Thermoprotei archaeon]|nr:MAG: hypothetical protein DRK00_07380 [Thermoprotei archaeon]